ncbi:hypothetical protein B0H17DRAFT_100 [Mycena rosella]|uniref:Uncharacterized protein n=1 Tax=Mycena rosella TaxID=1033263 RepID=A0AAD7MCP3_MYCRO|nr:hypothetical protein B0H17DRAFT_100 [Mycena rosella]
MRARHRPGQRMERDARQAHEHHLAGLQSRESVDAPPARVKRTLLLYPSPVPRRCARPVGSPVCLRLHRSSHSPLAAVRDPSSSSPFSTPVGPSHPTRSGCRAAAAVLHSPLCAVRAAVALSGPCLGLAHPVAVTVSRLPFPRHACPSISAPLAPRTPPVPRHCSRPALAVPAAVASSRSSSVGRVVVSVGIGLGHVLYPAYLAL